MSGLDRISELPEPILEDILLLLPWKDAAHMCVLSKRFKALWEIFPVLDFNFNQNLHEDEFIYYSSTRKSKLQKGSKDLIHIVDKALLDIRSKKVVINKFRLCMYIDSPIDASHVDGWIELASKNCLRELDVKIIYEDEWHCLPPIIFENKTMEVLRLNGYILEKPFVFSSLKVASMVEVCLDNDFFDTFFDNCPLLHDFTLVHCVGLDTLVIPSHTKLRRLMVKHIRTLESLTIEATKLESLCYSGIFGRLNICDDTLKYLREVDINSVYMHDHSVKDLVSKLPLLKKLALECCRGLKRVNISHCLLENLHLSFRRDVIVLEIDTPLLLSLDFGIHSRTLPEIFTINAPNLKETYLLLVNGPHYRLDAFWFLRLRRYLSIFNQHNIEILNSYGKISFNLDELSEVEVLPVPVVNQMKLENFDFNSSEAMLDGFLWSCRPEVVVFPYTMERTAGFIKFLREKLIDRRENPLCCKNRIVSWKYYIKDVNGQGLMTTEDSNASPSKRGDPEVCFELKWDI